MMASPPPLRRASHTERILLLPLVVVILVLAGLFYADWKLLADSREEVNRLHRLMRLNEGLLSSLKDLESGQRGYLLTGDQSYLLPYRKAKQDLPGWLDELEKTIVSPAQIQRIRKLRPLIQDKLAETDSTLLMRDRDGAAAALSIVLIDRGKATMDAIRGVSGEINHEAYAALETNSAQLETRSIRTGFGVLIGCGVLIGMVVLALGTIQRSTRRREDIMAELDAARGRFQVTLTSIGDGVITTDTAGVVTFLNPVAAKLIGWTVEKAEGQRLESVFPIVNEFTGTALENPVREALRDRRIVGMANHTMLLRSDGTTIPIDDSAAPIFDSQGVLTGAVMVFRDVTERRATEQNLRRWRHIFHHAGFGMMVLTPGEDPILEQVNPAFAAMHGYRSDELIGQPYDMLVPPDRRAAKAKLLDESSKVDHVVTETVHVRKDGTRFPALADFTMVRGENGEVVYRTGYLSDITDRKRAQEELEASENRYRFTADSLPQLIWTSKPDGITEYLNSRWQEQMGFSLEQTGPDGWTYFLHPDDRQASLEKWERALKSGETFQTECRLRSSHQEPRWYTCRAVPVRDGNSKILRWFGSCTDIHEQKLAADALRASKQELQLTNEALRNSNADLEQFAYAASHDLQEPLRMVTIYSQLLKQEVGGRLNGEAKAYLEFAVDGALRMEALLKGLLAYARAGSPEDEAKKQADGREALNKAMANLTASIQETGAEIHAGALPLVHMPEVHLVQVLQNLIGNALKYRTPGQAPVIHVEARDRDGNWVISVRDNGIGIAPQYQKKIFRIFGRLHGKDVPGTGIGLALCKKLIERGGGTLWLESEAGAGSTFYFTVKSVQ